MHKRLVPAAAIALCMCLCTCGRKEDAAQQEPVVQEKVIAEGSGNDRPDGSTGTEGLEEIADPGGSIRREEETISPDGLPVLEAGMLSDCITLCTIDGLEVSVMLEDDPDEEDAVTYKDFTRRGLSVPVGAGTYPEEIENALIGMLRDEEKKVTVTYPEDHLFMGLNGKTVTYRICVNSIARPDEPTEVEIGKALTYLEEETERINRERLTQAVMEVLIDGSEITAYPEKVIRQARSRYERKYASGFASLDDFLNMTGMSRAEFKEAEDEYVSRRAKEQLVLMALQEETGITAASEEYTQYTAVYGVNEEDPDRTLFEVIVEAIGDRIKVVKE